MDSISQGFNVELDEETKINYELYCKVKTFGMESLKYPHDMIEDFMLFERSGNNGTK